eukprot:2881980-Rhodomonas_salina.2
MQPGRAPPTPPQACVQTGQAPRDLARVIEEAGGLRLPLARVLHTLRQTHAAQTGPHETHLSKSATNLQAKRGAGN